jgi:hypothetical protein
MGMPPVMAPPPRSGNALRNVIIAVVLVAVILVAIIGYAVAGYASGEAKVSAATKSLNSVIDDENKLTSTFDEIHGKATSINTSSTFNSQQYKTLVAQFLTDSQNAVTTIDGDSATVAAADPKLDEQSWLTVIDKSNIDKMHTRFGHATKGLVAARFVAAGYVSDAQFFVAFADVIIDFDKLGSLSSSSDLTTFVAIIASLKTHVATALPLSTATGLSSDFHALVVDMQTLADDLNNLINAAIAGNDAGVTNYSAKADADATKIGAYDFTKMGNDLDAFYKPYIDTFNAEFTAATA